MRDCAIAVNDASQLVDLCVSERSLLSIELEGLQLKVVLAQLVAI